MKASMAALANTLRQINMSTKTALAVLVGSVVFWIGFCIVTMSALPESAGGIMYFDRLLFPGIGIGTIIIIAWVNLRPRLNEWAGS